MDRANQEMGPAGDGGRYQFGRMVGTFLQAFGTADTMSKFSGVNPTVATAITRSSNQAGLAQARLARDALAAETSALKGNARPATVTGGYNTQTGKVAAAACGGGKCAEDHVSEALGGGPNVRFTEASRPRTGQEVPVCERCESTYGRDRFPPNTRFKSDEK